ncbi:adhesion G-protein coupled receptor D1-like [Strongylocentrotus purpuratus]|uniref:Adhesion G-protein coupled receptor D1-like n=1 Tax=Strongylocentrotus purpuratus TaxID=7668 RepID=A0A7M7N8K9_STRPU|nr:adhesion G-protein coupled receptor D1-like [Strongylocentrotus purpuratus]
MRHNLDELKARSECSTSGGVNIDFGGGKWSGNGKGKPNPQITTSTTTDYAGSTGPILTTPTTTTTPTTSASVSTTTTTGSGSTSSTPTTSTPLPTTTKMTSNNTVVRRELANLISSFSVGSNASSSTNVSSREAATQLKELENAMSNVALNLLQGLADDEPLKTTIVVGETAVAIEIVPVADFEGTSFPSGDSTSTSDGAKISIPTVVLPENATGHLVSVFILHTTPPPLGGNLVENTGSNVSFELNSQVISASVSLADDGAVSFNEPITIVLRNNQEDSSQNSSLCVFYDFSADNYTGAWSTEGCRASDINATHVTCSCDHLTNFAILLQINDIEISEKDQLILQIISQVGIGLSLVFLAAGFIVIVAALKSLNNREAAIIHLNLMGAMIVGHLIFLIGIDDVYDQKRCKAVAMLLHFFYLVTFFWMLMEGVHIYFRATRVFKSTNYQLKIFHVFAWGTPGLIVMITALVNIDFYGTEQACWLSRERGAIWAFAGPVVFVIAMNIIVLVVVLQTFLTIKSINSKSKFEQAKRSTRAAVVLLPLLGITWIFGFLATGSSTIFFQYAFALLNSLQGVFICIFHCFTNDDVMKVVKLRYKRSKQQFDAIPSNHSIGGRFRSTTSTNKVSAVGRKEAFGEKSTVSTTATDTSVF